MTEHVASQSPFACDIAAIAPEQRASHQALAARLFRDLAAGTRELPDGYSFRFSPEHFAEIAAFVANERRCCPFFAFTIEVAPDQGPVVLGITGPAGVKTFIKQEIAR